MTGSKRLSLLFLGLATVWLVLAIVYGSIYLNKKKEGASGAAEGGRGGFPAKYYVVPLVTEFRPDDGWQIAWCDSAPLRVRQHPRLPPGWRLYRNGLGEYIVKEHSKRYYHQRRFDPVGKEWYSFTITDKLWVQMREPHDRDKVWYDDDDGKLITFGNEDAAVKAVWDRVWLREAKAAEHREAERKDKLKNTLEEVVR